MIKISLSHIRLYGYHGIHPEERITGGEFEVNLDVFFEPEGRISTIKETIDYTSLYQIVRQKMNKPADLLETLAQDIETSIRQNFPLIKQINITISKINPPLTNFRGRLSVSLVNNK